MEKDQSSPKQDMKTWLGQQPYKTKAHLETLNDGVIAIILTIMVLEIPLPSAAFSLHAFVKSISVFLVSFFVVADFWYELHEILITFKKASHEVVVANFLFLAALSLIPIMTKWIMRSPVRSAATAYGITYLVTKLFEMVLLFAAHRPHLDRYRNILHKLFWARTVIILVLNAALIAVSALYPRVGVYLYLILPVLSFFYPTGRTFRKGASRLWRRRRRS
jgi:uncharacterized membrane protein